MTAKEELKQYKYTRARVDEALEEYKKFKDRATKVNNIISDMPKVLSISNKIESNVTKMVDIAKEYEQSWIEAENIRLKIRNQINKIEEPYRTILYKRYIEDLALEEIAYILKSNYTYICELHGIALKKYENKK